MPVTNADFSAMSVRSGNPPKDLATKNKGKNEQDDQSQLPFAALINQSVAANKKEIKTATVDINQSVSGPVKTKAPKQAGQDQAAKTQNNVQKNNDRPAVKSDTPKQPIDRETAEDAKTALSEITEGIKEEVIANLDVSEEDLNEAMEVLALSIMDLLNPRNLEAVITELDTQGLLEGVNLEVELPAIIQELMPQIDEQIGQSLNENGISLEDFTQFLDLAADDMIELPEELKNLLPKQAGEDAVSFADTDISQTADTQLFDMPDGMEGLQGLNSDRQNIFIGNERPEVSERNIEEGVQVIRITDEDLGDDVATSEEASSEEENPEGPMMDTQVSSDEGSSENSGDLSQGKDKGAFAERNTAAHSTAAAHNAHHAEPGVPQQQQAPTNNFAQTLSQVSETTSYTSQQTREIIDQIVTRAQATITETVSRMEVELNPQSLGRMIMQVSEQEGVVTAKLIAQNENVKEALSTQMALLKESLEAKGIKVDAVEVAVGTHEFERNLEEGFAHQFNENEANEGGGSGTGRGRGTATGDIAAEEVSEEERLAQAVRRDSGTTVEYSA